MHLETDILIIGGGSAGCMAVIAAREHNPNADILIVEKGGGLCRTGSIATGMDGLNIMVQPGKASQNPVSPDCGRISVVTRQQDPN